MALKKFNDLVNLSVLLSKPDLYCQIQANQIFMNNFYIGINCAIECNFIFYFHLLKKKNRVQKMKYGSIAPTAHTTLFRHTKMRHEVITVSVYRLGFLVQFTVVTMVPSFMLCLIFGCSVILYFNSRIRSRCRIRSSGVLKQ